MVPVDDPDGDLIESIRAGDASAFNELVLKYRNRVMGIAARMLENRVDAEDLAQDVFVKVYHSLKSFKGEALFSTWLYRITANSCLNHRRRKKTEAAIDPMGGDKDFTFSDDSANPQTLLEKEEFKRFLEKAIHELPEEQRLVLILRDIEGLSYEEIADSLELELGTVRSRLHRARLAIQARIKHLVSPDPQRREMQ